MVPREEPAVAIALALTLDPSELVDADALLPQLTKQQGGSSQVNKKYDILFPVANAFFSWSESGKSC